jgi:site-specific recombinase XerD
MQHFRSKPLPEIAEKYLLELSASGRGENTISLYRAALHHFYRFLLQQRLTLSDLSQKVFDDYDEDLDRHHLKLVTRRGNRSHVSTYLRWLEARGDLGSGTCIALFPNYRADVVKDQQAELPELALRFLAILATANSKNTVNGYQSGLRGFYKQHQMRTSKAYAITRKDVEEHLIHLKNTNMEQNSRGSRLNHLRRYFEWLYEHKKLKLSPDKLVKPTDFPKHVEYLPRPYPVNIDLELQKRLEADGTIDCLGILLMRRCGLRVGEMRSLTLDCITTDFNSNWFLKVPLGKLCNERIIPLDPKTVEIVQKIQAFHSGRVEFGSNQKYLISNPRGKRRSSAHFAMVFKETTKGLAIPGAVHLHRLRHSFATSLLSAGLSITTLKTLLGHRDIRMTLNYAAVTQETIRHEFFEALTKNQDRYEVAAFPLKIPDLRQGMNQGFYDAQKYAKKIARDRSDVDKERVRRLCARMMTLRQELSDLLK